MADLLSFGGREHIPLEKEDLPLGEPIRAMI
jgi:hypothetical protein